MFEWLAETLGEDNLVRVDAELRFNSKKQNCLLYDKYADYNVYLKGIADLLLDTNKQRLVIDYKTAKLDSYKSEQLIFYELLTSSSIPHTRNGKLSSSIPHACNENLSTSIPLACKGELKGVADNNTPPKIENPFTESLYFSLLVENEKKSLSYMNKKKSRTEIYEEFRDKLHNLLADVFDTGFTYSKKNNKYYSDILRSDLKKKHIKSQSI